MIAGGPLIFRDRLDPGKLDAWAAETAAKDFGRHTDNFYLSYSFPGSTEKDFDWFDDAQWIVENWRLIARAARKARFKGICFDSEYYEGLPLFGYSKARGRGTRSIEEYRARVRERGETFMRAAGAEFPDLTLLVLFGFSGTFRAVPQHPVSRKGNYDLLAAFVDGLIAGCPPAGRVFDMHEQSFSFRAPGSFERARALMTERLPERSIDPARYRRHHRAGFSFWADCWCDPSQGRPFHVEDLERNYYSPHEFAWALHGALAWSDGYAWMWPGAIDWWGRAAKTVGADGKEARRPLPGAYIEALRAAHLPRIPEPPRSRRPNTYRVLSARTQEGWSDAEAFPGLEATHDVLADLPEEWRFRIDPDEAGLREGWARPAFDDREWPWIKIREFWEVQGFSPYDGAAWYRLDFAAPDLPPDRRIDLVFGGIADEAAIWVNGAKAFESPFGEDIRHERILADVTLHLRPGPGNSIVVRVWNTCWCGGIWKGVKLAARTGTR